jgi:hypothetical protein
MQYQQSILDENDFATKNALLQAQYDEELRLLKQSLDDKELSQEEYNAKIKLLDANLAKDIETTNKAKVDNEEATNQARIISQQNFAESAVGVVNALQGLATEGSHFAKVLALTEIAANTAIGFSKGLVIAQQSAAATGPGAAFAMPIFYASQVAAVLSAAARARKVLAKAPGGGGGGGGGDYGGGGGTPPISASMGQPQQTPQINMFQNNQNNQPMSGVNRVSVVDYTDIQNTGNRVAMLQNAVSLG